MLVAPFLAAGVIPWWITRWEFRPAFLDVELTRAIGVILILAGVPGVVDSFVRSRCRDWARQRRLHHPDTS
jgi:hypothetical protein